MTTILESAIEFAAIAHSGQLRKGTVTPYITHPYTVGMYLKQAGCDDEVVAAGILHDVLEDTPATYEELKTKFGERVAELVNAVSEPDKTMTWEARKQHTITSLKTASNAVRIIACADKLHNLRTAIEAVEQHGEQAWERFKRGRKEQEWYYRALGDVLESNDGSGMFEEFRNAVDRCFGSDALKIQRNV